MSDKPKYDFGAIATKYNVQCADGRTIRKGAFKDMDGEEVPLIWNHDHKNPYSVIGHALLESRDDEVYSYLSFNDSELGRHCKGLVEHGDVKGVSIYANKLKQNGNDVLHGVIRELSLVLAGANPEAYIDQVLAHGEDTDVAGVFDFSEGFVAHSEESEETEETKTAESESSGSSNNKETDMKDTKDENLEHSGMNENDIINAEKEYESMTDAQKAACNILVMMAKEEGEEKMAHNIFESGSNDDIELIHSALNEIIADAKSCGTLRDSVIKHADDIEKYGIGNIEFLQKPEGTDIYDRPQWINTKPNGWVSKVINGVHETPFAKVRMAFADITEDEARAKGYIKGNYKKEEFFKLQKRTVEPTTIYKKQKFDRDDVVDITWDLIPWIKAEMAVKLDEEKARAYLFGDGRSNSDEDKIDETKIIPVVKEEDLFVIKVELDAPASQSKDDLSAFAENLIDEAVLAQDDYDGSGNITAFFESKQVSRMLLLKDTQGHRLYKTMPELASAMSVEDIVKVPRSVIPEDIYGVALDLSDYNVGTNDKGKRTLFSDFDIDYNQMKYLLEERHSGCLIKPKSAIIFKKTGAAG